MRFAASVGAMQITNQGNDKTVTFEHPALVIEATSKLEAKGIGMEIAHRLYPSEKGWSCHHVSLCDIEANGYVTADNYKEVSIKGA